MESATPLIEGLLLTGIGMGVVFSFLAILVLVTGGMSRLVNRYLPEEVPASPAALPGVHRDEKLIAIVAAAIHQHRSRENRVD